MPERFTETLRAASDLGWSHSVQPRFVYELFAGAVPDAVMARYLIQDHRFLGSFLVLLGATLASADTFAARLRFGGFIGMMSAEENTIFFGRSKRSASPRVGARPLPNTPSTASTPPPKGEPCYPCVRYDLSPMSRAAQHKPAPPWWVSSQSHLRSFPHCSPNTVTPCLSC